MEEIGLKVPKSGLVAQPRGGARAIVAQLGYPLIVRPSFTLGGEGGGVLYNRDELDEVVGFALKASPVHQVLLEQSVLGWKEFELEVMRDRMDNAIVVCSVENVDPMGVHTGDSITVAPQQTLSDREYQEMRDDAFKVIRRVGVATGGSNIQFAVNPTTGERVVIEMNPRVSRSSALASKATGFPIAKIAALLAVGYTLDEIPNDITGKTYAAFEPTLDYTVVKIPRWAFEKFPAAPTDARHLDEVGGRGDGDRRHLPRGAAEGDRLARARRQPLQARGEAGRPGAAAPPAHRAQLGAHVRDLRRAAAGLDGGRDRRGDLDRSLVPARDPRDRRARERARLLGHRHRAGRAAAPRQALGHHRRAPRGPARLRHRGGRLAAQGARHRAGVQARRHLRRRVPGAHAVHVLDLRAGGRERAHRSPQGPHPRLRAQPHRPGHRVRLLLRARRVRAVEARLRDHHGQLQPGDGVDRLRHLRSALLRAAHARARARGGRARAADRRRGPARRADAAQAGARARGRRGAHPGDVARRDRPGRGPPRASARCCATRASASPSTARPPRWPRRARRPRRSATR